MSSKSSAEAGPNLKRSREEQIDPNPPYTFSDIITQPTSSQPFANNSFQFSPTQLNVQQSSGLPVYTSELGSLPLYGTADWGSQLQEQWRHSSPQDMSSGSSESTGSPSTGNSTDLPPEFWDVMFAQGAWLVRKLTFANKPSSSECYARI
jgi:hypothetical protein